MGKKVLVVDDSTTMVMSVTGMLTMAGFEVESAGDGTAALAKLEGAFRPDLIITDINMPLMGGMEFIGKVRALPDFKFTPILTLTTESDSGQRDEAKKRGATGWIVKPVAGPELIKVIKQILPGA